MDNFEIEIGGSFRGFTVADNLSVDSSISFSWGAAATWSLKAEQSAPTSDNLVNSSAV